jgi:hypothetical protein
MKRKKELRRTTSLITLVVTGREIETVDYEVL